MLCCLNSCFCGTDGKNKHIRNFLLEQTTVLLKPVFSQCPALATLFSESMWAATSLGGFRNFQSCYIKDAGVLVLPYSFGICFQACFWMHIISSWTCWYCCLIVIPSLCRSCDNVVPEFTTRFVKLHSLTSLNSCKVLAQQCHQVALVTGVVGYGD